MDALHRPGNRPWEDHLAFSKFALAGGEPLWSRPWHGYFGWAQVANPPCHCTAFRIHQVLDAKGYLYAAGKYSVRVIGCETRKLVGEFGSYGNMDCQGKASQFPDPELPFGTIAGVSVWRDRLFAVDVLTGGSSSAASCTETGHSAEPSSGQRERSPGNPADGSGFHPSCPAKEDP